MNENLEVYGFFNSLQDPGTGVGDRRYSASFLAEWLNAVIGTGILNGGTNLKVSASGNNYQLNLAPGKAWINGYYYHLQDQYTMQPEPADISTTRIDRVVLRLDLSSQYRSIRPYIKRGTVGTPPALDRDMAAGYWELSLARIEILPGATTLYPSGVVDERLNTAVCGIANSLVTADTQTLFNEFYSKYQEAKAGWDNFFGLTAEAGVQKDWYTWFNAVKATLGQTNVFDFDNLVRLPDFERTTVFNPNGSITETLKNAIDQSVFATRLTVFNTDKSITETVRCSAVLPSDVQITTTFNADGSIGQKVVNL